MSDNINCSQYVTFKNETINLMDKYFERSSKLMTNTTVKEKFVMQKADIHREFIECFQLLDMLHVTWLTMVCGIKQCFINNDSIIIILSSNVYLFQNDIPDLMAQVFRPCKSPIRKRMNEYIINHLERGKLDWEIQFFLRKW